MFKKSIAAIAAMMGLAAGAAEQVVESRHVEVSNGWRLRRRSESGRGRLQRLNHGPIGIKRSRKTTTAAQLKRAATKRRNIAKRTK
ncbi:hypothetical protein KLER11_gp66 [Pararheinheimera phage vB_PsoM_KLER1-1]|nr:hypothetical protein KLER11_gp66 [Pararheinheimera phage vB_PsoM_KLER1-1]